MFLRNRYGNHHFVFMLTIAVAFSLSLTNLAFSKETAGFGAATQALDDVQKNILLSQERIDALNIEVANLKKDQETFSKALVNAAQTERQAASNIAKSEENLEKLIIQEKDVHQKLLNRRAEFSEVLAALERMGLKPPPAILVHPDDALSSIRSAVLLGTIVPEMRARTLLLTTTLRELTSVRQAIAREHEQLKNDHTKRAEEQNKLKLLLAEKAKLQKFSEKQMEDQKKVRLALADKARSLEDLITELNRQQETLTPHGQQNDWQTQELANEVDFKLLRGKLQLPVDGKLVRGFSKGVSPGENLETVAGAFVTAPADATVAYADIFRSYGQLVILDVGNDYRILIAGMEHLYVTSGQFVLAGEPIGTMGSQFIESAAAFDIGKSTPMLYIEFRQGKEGKPIDPAPWWASRT